MQPDGTLGVKATHVETPRGWEPIGERTSAFVPTELEGAGRVITMNGQSYSVRFSQTDEGKVGGESYAIARNGRWEYFAGKGPVPEITRRVRAAKTKVKAPSNEPFLKARPKTDAPVQRPAADDKAAMAEKPARTPVAPAEKPTPAENGQKPAAPPLVQPAPTP